MTTKPMCVFMMKRNGEPYRWVVKVTINKERIYVGCFQSKDEAVKAWANYMTKNGGSENGKNTVEPN